ncbi:MAG: 50S ribosomal protein L15 [Candidatus Buchananbacteria bacterium]
MTLNLSNLKPAKGAIKDKKRVGRGGKRGSYSGKGMKGQRARSGGKSGLKALGLRQTLLRVPKLRGFKSAKPKMAVVDVKKMEAKFDDGEMINIKKLKSAKLIESNESEVKILGNSKIAKKLMVIANAYSASAKKAIEDAGGKAEIKTKGNK